MNFTKIYIYKHVFNITLGVMTLRWWPNILITYSKSMGAFVILVMEIWQPILLIMYLLVSFKMCSMNCLLKKHKMILPRFIHGWVVVFLTKDYKIFFHYLLYMKKN